MVNVKIDIKKPFETKMDYSTIMALKQLVVGEEQPEDLTPYKGSILAPSSIGSSQKGQKEIAKPYAKIEAKIGEKYIPKKQVACKQPEKGQNKYEIWSPQEVAQLPISAYDDRKQPQFEVRYRQKVGTEDVYLGLSGISPSSANCQQIQYKIKLPGATTKEIQLDLNQTQMVLQTKSFYLAQYFQYPMDHKHSKAKYIADIETLELILPINRQNSYDL